MIGHSFGAEAAARVATQAAACGARDVTMIGVDPAAPVQVSGVAHAVNFVGAYHGMMPARKTSRHRAIPTWASWRARRCWSASCRKFRDRSAAGRKLTAAIPLAEQDENALVGRAAPRRDQIALQKNAAVEFRHDVTLRHERPAGADMILPLQFAARSSGLALLRMRAVLSFGAQPPPLTIAAMLGWFLGVG